MFLRIEHSHAHIYQVARHFGICSTVIPELKKLQLIARTLHFVVQLSEYQLEDFLEHIYSSIRQNFVLNVRDYVLELVLAFKVR